MCLIVDRNQYPEILKEDMVVYKILQKDYKSEIRDFQYEDGGKYTADFKITYPEHCTDVWDFAVYPINSIAVYKKFPELKAFTARRTTCNLIDLPFKSISVGIHSFIEKPDFVTNYSNRIIVKCVIPRGANIYKNEDCGQVVSDKIIIGGIVW